MRLCSKPSQNSEWLLEVVASRKSKEACYPLTTCVVRGLRTQRKFITQEEEAELVGQIVDVFEDFLESKGVNVENEERDGEESPTIIFGTDYDIIAAGIRNVIGAWSENHQ